MKTVYMCFATDVIHEGHMNVVKKAKEYGKVVAGVLCDAEMVRYNRFPTVSFEERMAMVRNIPEIDEVIVQDRIMYDNVIKELKPDYVIHGDNWCDGPEKTIRDNVIALLKEYGGELIEVPYTYNEKVKKFSIESCVCSTSVPNREFFFKPVLSSIITAETPIRSNVRTL